ncbi:Spore coat protein S [Caloramator mitchellensis]|uniref:Spore coat protein S n=1 Tax=Caloramator mitchellensis TaxID=908809 RepID=A0A0R3JZT1_CALMK|nr:CotS family spore coat protein [Caloramator mitchellensis]KRQ87789.1 Spore coat protein S [Caloramator mitchellensis]
MAKDKRFLSTFSLDNRLFEKFGLVVSEVTPVRSVFVLSTNCGIKILKKIKYSTEDLNFIYNSLNKIRENYPYVINFRLTKDGRPFIEYDGDIYVVLDCVEGREAIFQNPIDLKKSAAALSQYHEASQNIDFYEKRFLQGKMINRFRERYHNIEKFYDIASMHVLKTEFDIIFLEYADYYLEQIKDAINQLGESGYLRFREYVLCHHDLAHHNILMGNDDNVYFCDFDYCVLDVRVHDLANIINKVAKDTNFSIDSIVMLLDSYNKLNPLSKDELKVLYALLVFPKDFYDISRDYYCRTKDWDEDEYLDKLIRKAGYLEDRARLLRGIRKIWL